MSSYRPFARKLETARLRLRPWRPSDAAEIRGLWLERDPRSLHLVDADGRPTVADMAKRIREQVAASKNTGITLLAIERKIEGDFIGYCGLIIGQSTLDEPEIAYELYRHAHGRGYATEAAEAVLAAGLDTGRTRFWATVRSWNAPSLRVLEKIGFVESGKVDVDPDRGDSVWMTGPVLDRGKYTKTPL